MKLNLTFAAMALALSSITAQAQVKLDFDLANRGQRISEDHYGIFYEEINHAGDGGLYAELVRNRSFEEDMNNPICWSTVGNAQMSLTTDNMLNVVQERALRVVLKGLNAGVRNEGYWGINIVNGREYTLSFWMRVEGTYTGSIIAELQNASGTNLGRATIRLNEADGWQHYTATITAKGNDPRGYLVLKGNRTGTIVLDVVSLFPPTFKDRPNGCRIDLAQKLADLHPRFMRFPGGCYIEGSHADGRTNRFEWKKTVGPIELRPGHLNRNWGYKVTDGLGYHEMLQLSEDLGAHAMFVVNMGIGHDWRVDENDIEPFIQEALDAIEYARGSTDTFYGKMRADNGHPEPFDLKYMEIGNEQEFMLNREAYLRRYMQFYRAIKTRWPDLHLIADSYYFDNTTDPVELKDEHYYDSPEFFINNYGRYDRQAASSTKIYVGEYAVTKNYGNLGNMNAAIGEAVFMQGSENNSEAVTMMSYAPIFTHENNYGWRPDMIRFNSSVSYGTPSYHVQKLLSNNVGKQNIRWTETDNTPNFDNRQGAVGLGTWSTRATFTDLQVKAAGTTFDVTDANAADWTTRNGAWTISGNTFTQTDASATNVTCVLNQQFDNSTLDMTVKAVKNGGDEGFLIIFDYKDEQNYAWLNLGGWGNTKHAVEQCKGGGKSTLAEAAGALSANKEYTIRVVKEGQHVVCYLDGQQIIDTHLTNYGGDRLIYTSANIDDEQGLLYVKLVNPSSGAAPAVLSFKNGRVTAVEAEVLAANNGTDENSTNSPNVVRAKKGTATVEADGTVAFTVPAFSVNVLRLSMADVVVPEVAPLPEPRLSYSFESGQPTDDSGAYTGRLVGKATIEQLADGNHVLVTGRQGEGSYMTLPVEGVQNALADATDYTISLNLLQRIGNNLGNYAWAFAASNGTSQYIGLINTGGNSNWYYQLKRSDSNTATVNSNASLRIGEWHNITYTQQGGQGRLYVDGLLRNTMSVELLPSQFVKSLNSAAIGHSPFGNDAIIENALFDDLRIWDSALAPEQVRALAASVTAQEYEGRYDGLADLQELQTLVKEVKNYYRVADDADLTRAYNNALRALSSGSTATQQQRYAELTQAVQTYQQAQLAKVAQGEAADLTFLITNSAFTRYNVAWQGFGLENSTSGYNGFANETTEQFGRTFDIWQQIEGLPAGIYRLTCSAFYRTGATAPAYKAWQEQTAETQLAQIYLNEQSAPVCNLFSSDAFTYDPYTYPDNLTAASTAFNTKGLYADNAVTVALQEGEPLRLGIRKTGTVAADWVAFDNFQLHFDGPITGIGRTPGSNSPVVSTQYFGVDGRRTHQQQHGVVIVKQRHADGITTADKVLQ